MNILEQHIRAVLNKGGEVHIAPLPGGGYEASAGEFEGFGRTIELAILMLDQELGYRTKETENDVQSDDQPSA